MHGLEPVLQLCSSVAVAMFPCCMGFLVCWCLVWCIAHATMSHLCPNMQGCCQQLVMLQKQLVTPQMLKAYDVVVCQSYLDFRPFGGC